MDWLVDMREVSKVFTGGTKTVALDRVTLHIAAGEFTAVMGASGSGKSTLLNLVAGLDRATSGGIMVDGIDLVRANETQLAKYRRSHIGFVFQFFNLLSNLTVLENVMVPAELAGTRPNEARARAAELLEELGMAGVHRSYAANLSGGQRQRVAIARALINRPALVLADEPTGALDSRSGDQVMELLDELNQRGQTILLGNARRQVGRRPWPARGNPVRRPSPRRRPPPAAARRRAWRAAPLGRRGGLRMRPVFTQIRAAILRRRSQTAIVLLVSLMATTVSTMALTLLVRSTQPFDDAFARLSGPHLVFHADAARVNLAQLQVTTTLPGVTAAGPPHEIALVPLQRGSEKAVFDLVGRDRPVARSIASTFATAAGQSGQARSPFLIEGTCPP